MTIQDFNFISQTITVPVGTTVTWTNNDQVEHTATSDTGVFGSGLLGINGTFSYTFNEPGVFPYHCEPHPFMTAQVIVE